MPRDFRSYMNEKNKPENKEKVSEYQNIIDKYKNMDNGELMSNLFSEANKLKQEGKLDSDMLNNLKSTLSPFLNTEQQSLLDNLIGAIDEQK